MALEKNRTSKNVEMSSTRNSTKNSTRKESNTGKKDSKRASHEAQLRRGPEGARREAGTQLVAKLVAKKKKLRLGDVCNLKITALAPNNIGIDEYSFPYLVFVPNAKLGSQIKAKILKIQESSYAVGQIIEEKMSSLSLDVLNKIPVKPGDVLTVSIKKQMEKGKAGIVELANNFKLIVPLSNVNVNLEDKTLDNVLDNVKVTVTRVKLNYGFAKIEKLSSENEENDILVQKNETNESRSLTQNKLEVLL